MKQTKLSGLRIFSVLTLMIIMRVAMTNGVFAQIYEPEGLNMPGAWNSWTNPPTNLALANPTQVPGGRLLKILAGQTRWQTIFSVNSTGADLPGGTYNWLFTSGPSTNYFQNKWAGVTVVMNTLQNYTKEGATDNSATLVDGKWYTMNWEDLGYQDSRAIFMETSAQPVQIIACSLQTGIYENEPVNVGISTNAPKCAEEIVYLRYTTDDWATSTQLEVPMTGTNGWVDIPGYPAGTQVSCYALTSTISSLAADFDLCTINLLNNMGANYNYIVPGPPGEITWQNLESPPTGEFELYTTFNVYGRAYIEGLTGQPVQTPGLVAWIGFNTENTDPSTWTGWSTWTNAQYNGPAGDNDEFAGDLALSISSPGTYYFATRFSYNDGPSVYGGYSATGGGPWDGITNISGVVTVTDPGAGSDFDWVNLQYPGSATIVPGQNMDVYAQAWIDGVTGQATPAPGVEVWIGYSADNTDPSEWTNWYPASFNAPSGNNDEYFANLGQYMTEVGTFYYASRFRLNSGEYSYGGYSGSGGGFWNGVNNVSGVLTVEIGPDPEIEWANLQYPAGGEILVGDEYNVYAQVYIGGITGQSLPPDGLESWIGYSQTDSDPSTWTNWQPAGFNASSGSNDEFMANLGTMFSQPGTWYYASRFKYQDGDYVYGGYSAEGGGFWNGVEYISGIVTVVESQVTFPVMFTIIDATELHDAIKLKGEMTSWDTIAMNPDNHTWTLTLDMLPGTYEWGAIEDDGTQYGLWLIEGGNPVMTLGEDGSISGMVTYTTLVTNSSNLPVGSKIYPNPVKDVLNLYIPGLTGFRILDMEGKLISGYITTSSKQLIDLSGYQSGVYQLDIMIGNSLYHQKIVKY